MTTPNQIGRYEVRAELGRGGMATVYSAHDPLFNRDVAIKLLPAELLHDPSFRTRFEREAKTVASLEHPAIVPVYDYGEENGQPYFVMRLMSGGSLEDRINNGPLSLEETSYLLSRIAPALDDAHSRGIVHRDIKPGNILFDQHHEPYLSDFGIAKLAESGATLTGEGIVGTPAYMSPEQGRGEGDIDGRADVYALGALSFEMLTGHIPFEAETSMGQVVKHLTVPVPNVLERSPHLPVETQAVLERAMAKRKFVRFSTAGELAQAFRDLAEGRSPQLGSATPTTAEEERPGSQPTMVFTESSSRRKTGAGQPVRRPSTRTPVQRGTPQPPARATGQHSPPPRRPPTPPPSSARQPAASSGGKLFTAVILVLMLAGIGYGGWTFYPKWAAQAPAAAVPTNAPTAAAQAEVEQQVQAPAALAVQDTPAPTSSPQPSPAAPTRQPTATRIPRPTITPSPTPSGPVVGGADMIAFLKDNDVWKARIDGTEVERLTTTGGRKFNLQWSPAGNGVIYITGRCIQSVDIDTKEVSTLICTNWAETLSGFEISPDGKQIALSLSDGLFLLPYDLSLLGGIKRQDQLPSARNCLSFKESTTKAIHWASNSRALAVVLVGAEAGRQVDRIRVMDVSRCGQDPVRIDEFPGSRFIMRNYANTPVIQSFAWDGDLLFAMNVNIINNYGDFYVYNMGTHKEQVFNPIGNQCCYRDFTWSPDRTHILFTFLDTRYMKNPRLYYLPYGTLGAGTNLEPFPLPEEFFDNSRELVLPALRPAR